MNSSRDREVSILIINVHSSLNAGDRALLECAVHQARTTFKSPRIAISTNWPQELYFSAVNYTVLPSAWFIVGCATKTPTLIQLVRLIQGLFLAMMAACRIRLGVSHPRLALWQKLFDAYLAADLVIAVSGNQFYSTGKYGWPFPVNAFSAELAHIFRKPLFIMPQSIGPFKRRWEKIILRSIYGRARYLFFREKPSLRLARQIGIPVEKTDYAPDPGFIYPPASRAEALLALSKYGYHEGEKSIGVTIIAPMGKALNRQHIESYYQSMANLFTCLTTSLGVKIYVFNQVTGPTRLEDDRTAVQRVRSLMDPGTSNMIYVADISTPALLKACYGMMSIFIASRLHSGIFAMGMGVPTLFINYLTKSRGILETLGLDSWGIDLVNVTDEALQKAVLRAWEERDRRAALLAGILPGVVSSVTQEMERVADEYDRCSKDTRFTNR